MKKIIIIILVFGMFSCSVENERVDVYYYFDLEDFFQKEIKHLADKNPFVFKNIALNSQTESKRMRIENWENELHVFVAANINRPAYLDQYHTDTTQISTNHFSVNYTALNKQLITRKLSVYKTMSENTNTIDSVFVATISDNLLYTTSQEMWYFPGTGYKLDGFQKIRFLKRRDFKIEVLFE